MSRIEADKEDLIRDGTAMVCRGEFAFTKPRPDSWTWQVVTIGFRRNGSPSFYFDQDPFYQFDADGRLRRAYRGGFLYRSQSTTLARMHRTRTAHETTLQRQDLSPQQLDEFQTQMIQQLKALQQHLQAGTMTCHRMVCPEENLLEIVLSFLPTILQHQENFLSTSINQR